jgi:aminoglycoside phosphotransferase
MNEQQKLRVLIPHWIEHNQEHAQEFLTYSEVAGKAANHLQEAAKQMRLVDQALAAALEKLGGALSYEPELDQQS